MNSLFAWGFVIFCAGIFLIAVGAVVMGFVAPKQFRHIVHKHVSKTHLVGISSALALLSVGSGGYVYWLYRSQQQANIASTTKAQVESSAPPANKSTGSLPSYEIVKKPSSTKNTNQQKNSNTQRITVYIDSSSNKEKVTALTTELLKQYKNYSSKQWYIDFFDNKKVANTYFDQIQNPKLSASEKRKVADHYVAVCVIDPGQKARLYLLKQNPQQSGPITLDLP